MGQATPTHGGVHRSKDLDLLWRLYPQAIRKSSWQILQVSNRILFSGAARAFRKDSKGFLTSKWIIPSSTHTHLSRLGFGPLKSSSTLKVGFKTFLTFQPIQPDLKINDQGLDVKKRLASHPYKPLSVEELTREIDSLVALTRKRPGSFSSFPLAKGVDSIIVDLFGDRKKETPVEGQTTAFPVRTTFPHKTEALFRESRIVDL
ncbi:hypothetical protein HAX54_002745 [Datura stramonium]|uniref:Uncharacterized protein n=1 Tax=Datura stramonium TaxID=4076 RepID=A0ABS8WRI0_DATST|nr:hypothetical protein [Datura stramonium]